MVRVIALDYVRSAGRYVMVVVNYADYTIMNCVQYLFRLIWLSPVNDQFHSLLDF
jgi:hypothetical protein